MATFDPYYTWLGIPPEDQPADHYRLLGLKTFESNADAISHAADKQMAHLRTLQAGKNAAASQQLLNEISAAGACLLNAEKKHAYDKILREKLAANAKASQPVPAKALPVAAPLPQRPVAPLPSLPVQPRPMQPAPLPAASAPAFAASPLRTTPAARKSSSNAALAMAGGGVLLLVAALGVVAFVLSQSNPTVAARPTQNKPSASTNNPPPPPPPSVSTSPPPPPAVTPPKPADNPPVVVETPPVAVTPPLAVAPPVSPQPAPTTSLTSSPGESVLRFSHASRLELTNSKALFGPDQAFTIELLIRLEPVKSEFLFGDLDTISFRFSRDPSGFGGCRCSAFGGPAPLCKFPQPTGKEWLHLAFCRETPSFSCAFVNGKCTDKFKIGPPELPGDTSKIRPLYLGHHPDFSGGFEGDIGGLRISSVARYSQPFVPPSRFENDSNTVALLDFSKAATQVEDLSGHGHHGIISGAQWMPGKPEYSGLGNVASNPPASIPPTPQTTTSEPPRPAYVMKEAVWNPKTGSWYCLLPDPMTFSEVAKIATAISATPVIIDSKEENDFVYRLSPKPTDTWLGLVKGNDGKLLTVQGQPAPFENWNNGEGTLPGEKHVFMMYGGKHADSYPDNKRALACLEWKHVPVVAVATPPERSLGDFLEPAGGPATGAALPLPPTEALEKARAQITEIFGPEASKATKPELKIALAQKMLAVARESKSSPAEEYALLDSARKLFIAAADVRQAMSAAEKMEERFADPDWSIRTATLDALSSVATLSPQDREALSGHCLQALDEALEAQKFDLADQYSLLATKVASKLKDAETRKEVNQRRTEMVKLKQEVAAYETALATLKQTPDDAPANLAAGKFLCFGLQDWEAGRPYLVKCGQDDLVQTVQSDLAADDGEAALKAAAGEAWLKWVETLKGTSRDMAPAAQARAKQWYQAALPNLAGLDKVRAEKYLAELASVADAPVRTGKSADKTPSARQLRVKYAPGLVAREYAKQPSQADGNRYTGWVPPEELGEPIAGPVLVGSLLPLKITYERNCIVKGFLKIDVAGEYAFNADAGHDRVALYINDELICPFRDGEAKVVKIKLEKGMVPIQVVTMVGNTQCRIKWQPPGATELGPIPPTVMFYLQE